MLLQGRNEPYCYLIKIKTADFDNLTCYALCILLPCLLKCATFKQFKVKFLFIQFIYVCRLFCFTCAKHKCAAIYWKPLNNMPAFRFTFQNLRGDNDFSFQRKQPRACFTRICMYETFILGTIVFKFLPLSVFASRTFGISFHFDKIIKINILMVLNSQARYFALRLSSHLS